MSKRQPGSLAIYICALGIKYQRLFCSIEALGCKAAHFVKSFCLRNWDDDMEWAIAYENTWYFPGSWLRECWINWARTCWSLGDIGSRAAAWFAAWMIKHSSASACMLHMCIMLAVSILLCFSVSVVSFSFSWYQWTMAVTAASKKSDHRSSNVKFRFQVPLLKSPI